MARPINNQQSNANQRHEPGIREHFRELTDSYNEINRLIYSQIPSDVYNSLCSHLPSTPPSWRVSATAWVMASSLNGKEHKARCSAVKKMRDAVSELTLDHPGRLSRLPPAFPKTITSLNVSGNNLSALHKNLPINLQHLNASNNKLSTLASRLPRTLEVVDFSNNQLQTLPTIFLLDNLKILNLSHNQLTAFPKNLPRRDSLSTNEDLYTIEHLDLSNNKITEFTSEDAYRLWLMTYRRPCIVDLRNNPLSQSSIACLENIRYRSVYTVGLEIRYSSIRDGLNQDMVILAVGQASQPSITQAITVPTEEPLLTPQPDTEYDAVASSTLDYAADFGRVVQQIEENTRWATNRFTQGFTGFYQEILPQNAQATELAQAATMWLTPQTPNKIAASKRLWQSFANEQGAKEFSNFLNALHKTPNGKEHAFQNNVAQWLKQLEGNRALRENTFAVSLDASESCRDRISLSYNMMRKLSMAASVSSGQYDTRLPELITLARGMFRLEELEKIACETTAILEKTDHDEEIEEIDEIEVFLGYQVKLRDQLALPVETTDMLYYETSGLKQHHLDSAKARVKTAERREFVHYLSTDFAPWQEVIKRLEPRQHERAQDKLIDAMGDEFSRRTDNRLKAMGLQNDPDAERTVGAQVRTEIAKEVYEKLTRDFLASKGMLHLLD